MKEAGHDLIAGLPPGILELLDSVVQGNILHYDILRFFHENPYAILTAPDMAVWVSPAEKPLAEAAEALAARGFLVRSKITASFTTTTDAGKLRQLDELFGFLSANPDVARRVRVYLRRQREAG